LWTSLQHGRGGKVVQKVQGRSAIINFMITRYFI